MLFLFRNARHLVMLLRNLLERHIRRLLGTSPNKILRGVSIAAGYEYYMSLAEREVVSLSELITILHYRIYKLRSNAVRRYHTWLVRISQVMKLSNHAILGTHMERTFVHRIIGSARECLISWGLRMDHHEGSRSSDNETDDDGSFDDESIAAEERENEFIYEDSDSDSDVSDVEVMELDDVSSQSILRDYEFYECTEEDLGYVPIQRAPIFRESSPSVSSTATTYFSE